MVIALCVGGIAGLCGWVGLASLIFLYLANFNPPLPYSPDLALWYLPYVFDSRVVQIDLGIAFGMPLIAAGVLTWRLGLLNMQAPLYGRSKFSGVREGQKTGLRYCWRPDPACLVLGKQEWLWGMISRYVCLPGNEHAMLFAKTGAGKGVSYVIPNCLTYRESLVVLDVKHENFRITAGHRKRMGQEIFFFCPLAEDGRSHSWNPLDGISAAGPDYVSKLQRRAYDIFPETQGKEKFWQDGARTAFHGIAVLVAETPELDLNPRHGVPLLHARRW